MTVSNSENYKSSRVRITVPYPLTRTLCVKKDDEGKKLGDYLSERFPYVNSGEWNKRIEKKWIWLDDGEAQIDRILRTNQLIFHYTEAVKEPTVPDAVMVIREQENWLLVYKPAPMPMHQGGRYFKNTLNYILQDMGYQNLSVVHRLDAVTSGLVLLAKNRNTANRIQLAFTDNKVKKWYYAVVKGMAEPSVTVDLPIRRKKGFVFECGYSLAGSKPAKTIIERVKIVNGESLVKCFPVTGRTHQIRLHLREAGLPIIDDPIYGPDGDSSGKQLQNRSISLQSSGIKIEEMEIFGEIGVPE
ncbi:MAG: RluA family pseudouridine synthase, partial [Balneolaceae bacterium]